MTDSDRDYLAEEIMEVLLHEFNYRDPALYGPWVIDGAALPPVSANRPGLLIRPRLTTRTKTRKRRGRTVKLLTENGTAAAPLASPSKRRSARP